MFFIKELETAPLKITLQLCIDPFIPFTFLIIFVSVFDFFFFFDEKGEGHPKTVPPPVVIKTMMKGTYHGLQGSSSRGA